MCDCYFVGSSEEAYPLARAYLDGEPEWVGHIGRHADRRIVRLSGGYAVTERRMVWWADWHAPQNLKRLPKEEVIAHVIVDARAAAEPHNRRLDLALG